MDKIFQFVEDHSNDTAIAWAEKIEYYYNTMRIYFMQNEAQKTKTDWIQ